MEFTVFGISGRVRSDPRPWNQTFGSMASVLRALWEGGSGQRLTPCGPGSRVASGGQGWACRLSLVLGLVGIPVCPWEVGTGKSRVAVAGCSQAVRP